MLISHDTRFTVTCGDTSTELHTIEAIEPSALDQFERVWRPLLLTARARDAGWRWRDWTNGDTEHVGLSLFHGDACQAMMMLSRREWMRGPRDGGLSCAYIKYFAVAPWNRSGLAAAMRMPSDAMKPTGSCLMLRAIEISKALGHAGRLAWCALPGSVARYRAMFPAVVTTGLDVVEGLDWYEVGVPETIEFTKRMEPCVGSTYRTPHE